MAMARQNKRQRHGEFLLPMQLVAGLSVKTIIKDTWHCPITKGAAIKQGPRHGKMSSNGTANSYGQCHGTAKCLMSSNGTANFYCQCDYLPD